MWPNPRQQAEATASPGLQLQRTNRLAVPSLLLQSPPALQLSPPSSLLACLPQ
jgi:hypothetical protein